MVLSVVLPPSPEHLQISGNQPGTAIRYLQPTTRYQTLPLYSTLGIGETCVDHTASGTTVAELLHLTLEFCGRYQVPWKVSHPLGQMWNSGA